MICLRDIYVMHGRCVCELSESAVSGCLHYGVHEKQWCLICVLVQYVIYVVALAYRVSLRVHAYECCMRIE